MDRVHRLALGLSSGLCAAAAIGCGSTPAPEPSASGSDAGADVTGSAEDARPTDDGSPSDADSAAQLASDSSDGGTLIFDGARPKEDSGDAASEDSASAANPDASAGDAAAATIAMEVTFYGWADNSPPGNAIAYPANAGHPTVHNAAGGTGTYADPITFATAPAEFAQGVRLYVPFIEKYVVMEDSCGQCTTDWTNSRKYHIDLWMNSNGSESTSALVNCENSWTRSQTDVETNPPPTRTVTTAPLFDPATNTCRTSP
jgi:3D (Asp-Asp-Asp) domain-containing protein